MTSNCHTFSLKKPQKSVTIWEHLPKRYYFWTIIKQKKQKVCQFEIMDCIPKYFLFKISDSCAKNIILVSKNVLIDSIFMRYMTKKARTNTTCKILSEIEALFLCSFSAMGIVKDNWAELTEWSLGVSLRRRSIKHSSGMSFEFANTATVHTIVKLFELPIRNTFNSNDSKFFHVKLITYDQGLDKCQ